MQTKHDVGHILGVVYFAHEVGQVAKSQCLDLERGRGRKTMAYKVVAEALGMKEKTVAIICKQSRNFMLLLKNGGPGSLQRWDKGMNSLWENHFNKTEVKVLLQFRKECLQHIEDESHKLDLPATQMLIDGMVAYGWGYHELAATHSSLTDCLRLYINLDQLAHDRSCVITQPLKHSATEDPDTSDRIQNKRRYRSLDHSVKRLHVSQSLEEPDISTMIGLSPMPGELDISMMIGLSPMPGEPDISAMIGLSQMSGEPEIDAVMLLSPTLDISVMQPAQASGLDISVMPHQPTAQCPQACENWV